MKTYTVLEGQSLLDIALMLYGDATGVLWLLADNKLLRGPEDRLFTGQTLTVRGDVVNVRQRNYLADFGNIQTIDADEDFPSGIGYWRIDEYQVL
jgi:hypothetical protein